MLRNNKLRTNKLRTNSIILIGALATLDLLTSSIIIPLYVVVNLVPSLQWHKVTLILMVVVVVLSLLTVVYISLDRFAHVYYLQSYNVSRRKLLIGLVAFLLTPFLLFSIVRGVVNRMHGRSVGRLAGRVSASVFLALCMFSIACAYSGIVILLRRHAAAASDHLRKKNIENQRRASKTSLLIVVAVVVMNTPALIYCILLVTGAETSSLFCTITLATLFGSSPINPVVYFLRMPQVKRHVLLLLGCSGSKETGDEGTGEPLTSQTGAESLPVERNMSVVYNKDKEKVKLINT